MINIDNLCMGCMNKKENEEPICPKCGYNNNTTVDNSIYIKPGTIINNYLFGRVLGHGGFGITYIGMHVDSGEVVAIKEYFPTGQTLRTLDQSVSVYNGKEDIYIRGLEKYKEEAEMLKKFAGFPGIVDSKDFFECNNTAYFVMEYVEGITLKEYVEQKGGSIAFSHVREILMPIMDALGEMHRYGIIHRDISPDNIYITLDKRIKLLDFGAARYANNEDNKSLSIIIKHGYAPKEQYYTKGNQGPWTDVYAVAATAYFALTGQTPQASLERMEKDNVAYPSRIGADISIDEEQVLMVAMSIKEIDRYQNMKSFQKAILKVRKEKAAKKESAAPSAIIDNDSSAKDKTDIKTEKNYITINKKAIMIAGIAAVCVAAIVLAIVFLPNLIQPKSTEAVVSGEVVDEDKATVPNVKSMTEKEALALLEKAMLKGDVKYEYSSSVDKGSVIQQSVPADNTLDPQATVTLLVSLGEKQEESTASATPEPTQEAAPEPTDEATPVPTEETTTEATPEPTAEATPGSTTGASPKPTAEVPSEPTQKPTPEVTSEPKWSEWSEWRPTSEINKIIKENYSNVETKVEEKEQVRYHVDNQYNYRYRSIQKNWGEWIAYADGENYDVMRSRYPAPEYDVSGHTSDESIYRVAEIDILSDWSPWITSNGNDIPEEYFGNEYEIQLNYIYGPWLNEIDPNLEHELKQSRKVSRFRYLK